MDGTCLSWSLFGGTATALWAVDWCLYRGGWIRTRRGTAIASVLWIVAGLLFSIVVWLSFGGRLSQEYLAAYLMEESLSLDNLFVFLLVFQTLNIPPERQHKALFWGIFGAVVFRAVFIFVGASALKYWSFTNFVFGGFLFLAAWHAFREDFSQAKENKFVKWLSRRLPLSQKSTSDRFWIKEHAKYRATPLLMSVVVLELVDVLFAVDSVPAAFSVTHNEFVLYSSNVFAILGLRALYLVMAKTIAELKYLHYGMGAVLIFAGVKLVLSVWEFDLHPLISVGIILSLIGAAILASVRASSHRKLKSRHSKRRCGS